MKDNDSFFNSIRKNSKKVVIYGAGTTGQKIVKYIDSVECFCDKRASEIKAIDGIPIIAPNELSKYEEEIYILVCVGKQEEFRQVSDEITRYAKNAKIFNYFSNDSFQQFDFSQKKVNQKLINILYINIVCMDEEWILGKFAKKLKEYLIKFGVKAEISKCFDKNADVNHYIAYRSFVEIYKDIDFESSIKTTMITHVDCAKKVELIKWQSASNTVGICMSKDTMQILATNGVPRNKICYINPAQDGIIKPKKFVLGITHKTHADIDHRKRTEVVLDICKKIDSNYFKFSIMGMGWKDIVLEMQEMGFEVIYYDSFQYDIYTQLMQTLDYYLFFGYDEGSMGYLDALAAGVKTIVTPQGFHLDIPGGITYECSTASDFINTLISIKAEREKIVKSVEDWTWEAYTLKHLEVWNYLAGYKKLGELFYNKHKYLDGIFSLLIDNIESE